MLFSRRSEIDARLAPAGSGCTLTKRWTMEGRIAPTAFVSRKKFTRIAAIGIAAAAFAVALAPVRGQAMGQAAIDDPAAPPASLSPAAPSGALPTSGPGAPHSTPASITPGLTFDSTPVTTAVPVAASPAPQPVAVAKPAIAPAPLPAPAPMAATPVPAALPAADTTPAPAASDKGNPLTDPTVVPPLTHPPAPPPARAARAPSFPRASRRFCRWPPRWAW